MYENEMSEVSREKVSYGANTTARESEIPREYGRLMKAIKELGMTCESLEVAFAPVLRSPLEPTLSEYDSAKDPTNSTEHGIALLQARNSIEGITRQVRSVLERKEI